MRVTVGCEHEWGDFPLSVPLPKGFKRDIHDYTVVNSNGVANDPTGRYYGFGGEINTPPTDTADGQVECMQQLLKLFPMAVINYRSNLHVHVKWPGLAEDLNLLKQVQRFIHETMRDVLAVVEPIPRPTQFEFQDKEEFKGALRRYRRRCVSHHMLLTPKRLSKQLSAKSIDEFHRWEVPLDVAGRPQWQCQPRLCVNLRHALEKDGNETIEFRHFPGTLDPVELKTCVIWCVSYLTAAVSDDTMYLHRLLEAARGQKFPKFPEYVHWQELRYRATCHDGSVPKDQIVKNIKAIEAGTFDAKGKVS